MADFTERRVPDRSADPQIFPAAIRWIHWGAAALLVVSYGSAIAIGKAQSGADAMADLMLHRSIGVLVLLLTAVRLIYRWRLPMPALLELSGWMRLAAQANIVALYALLIGQPLIGLIASLVHGDHLSLFGVITLPHFLPIDRPLGHALLQIHLRMAGALVALSVLHLAAALYHHFILRDGILRAMLPSLARGRKL